MGQFSFISRNGEQIRNEYHAGQKVWMVYKDGTDVKVAVEDEYDGYGRFGGLDYYEVVATMNGKKTRDEGLTLAFEGKDVLFPQLFTVEPTQQKINNIVWWNECEHDPNQGWVTAYENEEE